MGTKNTERTESALCIEVKARVKEAFEFVLYDKLNCHQLTVCDLLSDSNKGEKRRLNCEIQRDRVTDETSRLRYRTN